MMFGSFHSERLLCIFWLIVMLFCIVVVATTDGQQHRSVIDFLGAAGFTTETSCLPRTHLRWQSAGFPIATREMERAFAFSSSRRCRSSAAFFLSCVISLLRLMSACFSSLSSACSCFTAAAFFVFSILSSYLVLTPSGRYDRLSEGSDGNDRFGFIEGKKERKR